MENRIFAYPKRKLFISCLAFDTMLCKKYFKNLKFLIKKNDFQIFFDENYASCFWETLQKNSIFVVYYTDISNDFIQKSRILHDFSSIPSLIPLGKLGN